MGAQLAYPAEDPASPTSTCHNLRLLFTLLTAPPTWLACLLAKCNLAANVLPDTHNLSNHTVHAQLEHRLAFRRNAGICPELFIPATRHGLYVQADPAGMARRNAGTAGCELL